MEVIPIGSLIALFLTIVVGFIKKINMGILALAFSLILGIMGNVPVRSIIKGFNSNLFITLVGVSILFGIAQHNETLKLIVAKMIRLTGRKSWLIPIIMYVVIYLIAFLGAGTITGFALAALFGVPLAKELKENPFLFTTMGQLGAIGGGIAPWAPTGTIGIELAKNAHVTGTVVSSMIFNTTMGTIVAAIFSYIVLKGYRIKAEERKVSIDKFNTQQKLTILGIIAMVIGVTVFKLNIGLLSFFISIILILINVGNDKQALSCVPWNTIILILGMGILMNLVVHLGGIELLSNILSKMMNHRTVGPLLALSSGILSFFSSTSGVVMPTMIPTVPIIIDTLGLQGKVSGAFLVSAVISGSSPSGLSPLSTGGAFVMAAIGEEYELSTEEFSQQFKKLFFISAMNMLVIVVYIFLAGFKFA